MSWYNQESIATLPNMPAFSIPQSQQLSKTHFVQDEHLPQQQQIQQRQDSFLNLASPLASSTTSTTPVTQSSYSDMSKLLPNNLWDDSSISNTLLPLNQRSVTPMTNFSNSLFSQTNSNFGFTQQQQQQQQQQTIGLTLEQQQLLIQQQFLLQQQLQQQQLLLQNIQPNLNSTIDLQILQQQQQQQQQQKFPLTEENLSLLTSPTIDDSMNISITKSKPNSNNNNLNQSENLSQNGKSSSSQSNLNPELYKTELCQQFMKKQSCPYGSKCQFAHGEDELKFVKRPSNWKTKDCANWTKFGECRYGRRCCFKHGEK